MEQYYKLLEQRKYDEAIKARAACIPSKLYKFFVLVNDDSAESEKRLKALENDSTWCAMPYKMNDPYESHAFCLNREELRRLGFEEYVIQKIEEGLDLSHFYYLCCFTGNNEHFLPMWAYYTNSYQGFCIEYDVVRPKLIHPVEYAFERPALANTIYHILLANKENRIDDKMYFFRLIQELLFYTKNITWKHEKEYRVVVPVDKETEEGILVSNQRLGVKPHRLIAGCCCSDTNKQRLIEICKQQKIEYRQAIISKNSFAFEEE